MENTHLALIGGQLPQSLERMSKAGQRRTSQEIERTVAQGIVTNTREQSEQPSPTPPCKNVGALSALEKHLIEVAPLGAVRYQHIVDAYALGAAQTIARW